MGPGGVGSLSRLLDLMIIWELGSRLELGPGGAERENRTCTLYLTGNWGRQLTCHFQLRLGTGELGE
jgi:hypothetical protein